MPIIESLSEAYRSTAREQVHDDGTYVHILPSYLALDLHILTQQILIGPSNTLPDNLQRRDLWKLEETRHFVAPLAGIVRRIEGGTVTLQTPSDSELHVPLQPFVVPFCRRTNMRRPNKYVSVFSFYKYYPVADRQPTHTAIRV